MRKAPIPDASQGQLGTNTNQTSTFALCLPYRLLHPLRAPTPFSSSPNHLSQPSAAA